MREIFSLVGKIALDGMTGVESGLNRIDKQGKKLSKQMKKTGREITSVGVNITKLVSGPVAALGAGMLALANQTGKYADSMLDLEQITGLSTDTLQEMEHVARIAGVEFRGLTDTIQKFQGRLPQIVNEGGRAYEAIERLGINVFDASGEIRDMNDLFPEMLGELNKIENVTDRNAVAQQIFGRQMKDVAPVLGLTAEQMKAAREEAHELGLVMDREALEAANEYRIETEKLGAEFKALSRNLVGDFIPVLRDTVIPLVREQIIPMLTKFADKVRELGEWFSGLSPQMQETIVKITALATVSGPALIVVGKLVTTLAILAKTIVFVKTAIIGLTAVMAANPFILAAVAIGGIAIAIHKTGKAWAKWRDEIGDDIAEKQASAAKDSLEEIIGLYGKLALADREFIPEDEYMAKKARIEELETNLADLGVALEGSMGAKAIQAQNALTDLELGMSEVSEESEKLAGKIEEETDELEKNSKAKKKATDDEKALAEAKRLARVEFEQDWTERLLLETATRLDAVEYEKEKTLEEAKRLGADRQAVLDYYAKKRQDILDEEAEYKKKKEQEVLDARTQFEQEWTNRFEQSSMSRRELLDRQKEDALAKADELGASREAINQYYAQREMELNLQTADNFVNTFSQAIGQVSSMFSQATSKRISQIDKEAERQRQKVKLNVTDEKKQAEAIAKIDEEADKKKIALQREQANREKAAGIFGVVISTAQAIMKGYEQLGPVAGSVAAVFLAGLGAFQAGSIAAEPIPMEKGAFVPKRPGGVFAQIAEGGQDEMVMPMQTGIRELTDGILNGLSSGGDDGGVQNITNGGDNINVYVEINSPAFDRSTLVDFERTMRGLRIDESRRLVLT